MVKTSIGLVIATVIAVSSCNVSMAISKENGKSNYPKKYKMSTQEDIKYIHFNPENIREKSNLSIVELDNIFEKVGQAQMKELSLAILDAENLYNVNALFLAGLVAQESGWTRKPAGNGTNLTGYQVYTPTSRGAEFNSRYDNIMQTAKLISDEYLKEDGKYYNGLSIEDINKEYCLKPDGSTDYNWSKSITSISNMLKNNY